MKKASKNNQESNFLKLVCNPILVLFLIFLFCVFLAGFYFLSLEKIFIYHETMTEVNMDSFNAVLHKWEKDDEVREKIGQRRDISFLDNTIAIDENSTDEESIPEQEEMQLIDNAEEVDEGTVLTEDDIEKMLTETLYEYYKGRGESMPGVTERAALWEKLGLGNSKDYHGYYHQNIIFLRTLMSENKKNN